MILSIFSFASRCSLFFIILPLNSFVRGVPVVWPGLGYGPCPEVTHTPVGKVDLKPHACSILKQRLQRGVYAAYWDLEEEGGDEWRLSPVCQADKKGGGHSFHMEEHGALGTADGGGAS